MIITYRNRSLNVKWNSFRLIRTEYSISCGNMAMGDFLSIQPSELRFPFELRKQSSCSIQLTNKTGHYIAFKFKTTNPKKYAVRPNFGIILPNDKHNVTVIMQAQKKAPADMQCQDKFLIQSVVAPYGATSKDKLQGMFNRADGKVISEFKLRVVYIPANPPSPVWKKDEGRALSGEDDKGKHISSEAVAKSFKHSMRHLSSSESQLVVTKLKEEKVAAVKEFHEGLESVRKQGQGGSTGLVLFVLLLGILVGYFIQE